MAKKRIQEFAEEVKTKGWGRYEALNRTIGFLLPYHDDLISANDIREVLLAVVDLPLDKWEMPVTRND
jgi:hypothetical protein